MKHGLRAIPVLVFALLITACGEDELRKGSKLIVNGLKTSQQLVPVLKAEGRIDEAEEQRIIAYFSEAIPIAERLRERMRTYKASDTALRQELITICAEVSLSLTKLTNDGVLKLKDEKAQSRLRIALAVANLAISVVATELSETSQ